MKYIRHSLCYYCASSQKIRFFPAINFLLIGLLLIVNSCKKDPGIEHAPLPITINEAKAYFENEVLPAPKDKINTSSENSLLPQLIKNAGWDKAYLKDISIGKSVVIPLSYETNVFVNISDKQGIGLGLLSYLTIYKNAEQGFSAEWVIIHPDEII